LAVRSRTHQLEDESITAFRRTRPSRWPVRQKGDDYGIDLEVEIFDNEENSTGLLFFVQLKATDAKDGRKVSLARDYLDNICSYSTPCIIVRYFARDERLYWRWAIDMLAEFDNNKKSKTFHFEESDRLDIGAFDRIDKSLRFARLVKLLSPEERLPIGLCMGEIQGRRKIDIRRNLDRIEQAPRPAVSFFHISDNSDYNDVPTIIFQVDKADIIFGPRFKITVEIDESLAADVIGSRILYSLCSMMRQANLVLHASRHAKSLLELSISTDVRMLAAAATQCIFDDPADIVDLAIQNKIHEIQDENYLMVIFHIYLSQRGDELNSRHAIRFLEYALASASRYGPESESAILYSMGNAARRYNLKEAVSYYVRAKNKNPAYKNTSYFIREIAGCLFLLCRFRFSMRLYERAGLDLSDPCDCLVLADACMFSGLNGRAIELYKVAYETQDIVLQSEAWLKIWLAGRNVGNENSDFSSSGLASRFNGGIAAAAAGRYADAIEHFLVCALIAPNDHDSWSNSIMSCLNLGSTELFARILILGLSIEGIALRDELVEKFDKLGMSDVAFDMLSEAYNVVKDRSRYSPVHRMNKAIEHSFDATVPLGS